MFRIVTHRIVVCAVLFLAVSFAQFTAAQPTAAQAPAAQSEGPRFEVVAIKPIPRPTPGDGTPFSFNASWARVEIRGHPLFSLLTRAFRVESPQLDVPDFTHDEFFDIQAAIPSGATPEQVPEMLQAMFAERFKLAYHRETREYQVHVLTVGRSSMKLPRLPDGTQPSSTYNRLADGTLRVTMTGKMSSLFPTISSFGELQMVDETGLDGIYTWVRDQAPSTPDSRQEAVQDSFKAMIEAAGLKLETRKVLRETIVVDHLEKKPTDN